MRAVQGLGAAMMLPAALSIVMNMFEEGAERNKALGIWGGLGASGCDRRADRRRAPDPVRRMAVHLLPQRPDRRRPRCCSCRGSYPRAGSTRRGRRFDALGAIAGTGGLVLLVYAISQAPQYGWGAHANGRGARGGRRAAGRVPGDRAPGRRTRSCRCGSSGCARSPARTRQACCWAAASSRSSSSARCTCSRCCTTARCRPASRGWPRR